MIKRIGPRTDPCGTPQMMSTRAEHLPPQRTCCRRQARYDRNQSNAKLSTPKVTRSRSNKIPWSTESKAAERLSRTSKAVSSRSTASKRSESTQVIAVSVECPCQKPDWVDGSKQFKIYTLLHNFSESPLWSMFGSKILHFILHSFTHPIIFFSQNIIATHFAVTTRLCPLFSVSLSSPYLELKVA